MAEPARTTGSGLSHPSSIPGAAEERERIEVGGGSDGEGGLTPRAGEGGCIGTTPMPSSEGPGD
eukprot:6187475-Pleurochrysis_carterae.AAC.3